MTVPRPDHALTDNTLTRRVDDAAGHVEGLAARALSDAYRRLGPRYLPAFVVLEVLAVATICTGAVWLVSRYRPMTLAEFAAIAAASVACGIAVLAWAVRHAWNAARPVVRWIRSTPDADAEAAWQGSLVLPLVLLSGRGVGALLIALLPCVGITSLVLDIDIGDVPALLAVGAVAAVYGSVVHIFALELALRPVVLDLASAVTRPSTHARPHLSLRWKLLLILPAINVIGAVTVAALAPAREGDISTLGVTVLIAIAVAITVAFVPSSVLGGSILSAVGELGRGTRRMQQADFTGTVAVSSTDELGRLGDAFNDMVDDLAERAVLRDALSSYVHPGLPDRILTEGIELAGEEFDVTIVFIDLVGFTAFAETATPAAAVARVNTLLNAVVPIIGSYGGHVDKFVGDGVLAVFGAPDRAPDHADRAVAAAGEIGELSRREADLRVGVGINSGKVVAGTVGAQGRFEFTVIGDTVNVASRIEHATRELSEGVLLTQATRDRLSDPHVRSCGTVNVRGKREPVAVFAPQER